MSKIKATVDYEDGWKTFVLNARWVEGKIFSEFDETEVLSEEGAYLIEGFRNRQGWIIADENLNVLEDNVEGNTGYTLEMMKNENKT